MCKTDTCFEVEPEVNVENVQIEDIVLGCRLECRSVTVGQTLLVGSKGHTGGWETK